MTTATATAELLVWLLLGGAWIATEVVARTISAARVPRLGRWLTALLARVPARGVIPFAWTFAWTWLGWHAFAR